MVKANYTIQREILQVMEHLWMVNVYFESLRLTFNPDSLYFSDLQHYSPNYFYFLYNLKILKRLRLRFGLKFE